MSKNYFVENNRMTSGLCELSGITRVLWLTATLILGKQIFSGQGESKSLAFSVVRVYLNYVCLRIEQAYAFM